MAVNRRPSKERLNLDPGLSGKTNLGGNNHLKLFWKVSQSKLKHQAAKCPSTGEPSGAAVTLLNLENLDAAAKETRLGADIHPPGSRAATRLDRGRATT